MILASTKLAWYLTRSSGFVALILLTASVALGVLAMARLRTTAWPRFVTQALHRNVSLLAVCFLGAHIATTVHRRLRADRLARRRRALPLALPADLARPRRGRRRPDDRHRGRPACCAATSATGAWQVVHLTVLAGVAGGDAARARHGQRQPERMGPGRLRRLCRRRARGVLVPARHRLAGQRRHPRRWRGIASIVVPVARRRLGRCPGRCSRGWAQRAGHRRSSIGGSRAVGGTRRRTPDGGG